MNAVPDSIDSPSAEEVCTIVALYDGNVTRARAMAACDYLVHQFWPELELKFHWWRTDFLRDAALASVAAANALTADFLIICSETGAELSPALETWFESWLSRRGEKSGALVDLSPASRSPAREQFLREAGRRGRFDYLTAVPAGSESSFNSAAADEKPSGSRNDRLSDFRPPTHYGLNE